MEPSSWHAPGPLSRPLNTSEKVCKEGSGCAKRLPVLGQPISLADPQIARLAAVQQNWSGFLTKPDQFHKQIGCMTSTPSRGVNQFFPIPCREYGSQKGVLSAFHAKHSDFPRPSGNP